MRQFRTHIRFLRPIAAVLLAVSLHACTRWIEVPEPKTLASSHRGTVRLTISGQGNKRIVKHASVVGDSLVWSSPDRAAVPLASVLYVEARGLDPIGTGFFALTGALFLVFFAIHQ
jgi:hypothetical protein